MRVKIICAFVAGMIVGASTIGFSRSVGAQIMSAQSPRMSRSAAEPVINSDGKQGVGMTSFLKDSKSGGCWLYVTETSGNGDNGVIRAVAVAPAPTEACGR